MFLQRKICLKGEKQCKKKRTLYEMGENSLLKDADAVKCVNIYSQIKAAVFWSSVQAG